MRLSPCRFVLPLTDNDGRPIDPDVIVDLQRVGDVLRCATPVGGYHRFVGLVESRGDDWRNK
jgi:hypothetical protein